MTRAQAAWCCQRCSGCGGSGATPISGRTSSTPLPPSARCWSRKAASTRALFDRREDLHWWWRAIGELPGPGTLGEIRHPHVVAHVLLWLITENAGEDRRRAPRRRRDDIRGHPRERARSPARHGPRDVVASRVAGVVLFTSLVHHRRRSARDAARAVRRRRAGAVVVDRAVARRACARSQTEPRSTRTCSSVPTTPASRPTTTSMTFSSRDTAGWAPFQDHSPSAHDDDRAVPARVALADGLRDRIIEIELARGDVATHASNLALSLGSVDGAGTVTSLLLRLGRGALVRGRSWGNTSREAVYSHLVQVSYPAPSDSPETLQAAAVDAGLPDARLLDLAMYAPQWALVRRGRARLGWARRRRVVVPRPHEGRALGGGAGAPRDLGRVCRPSAPR